MENKLDLVMLYCMYFNQYMYFFKQSDRTVGSPCECVCRRRCRFVYILNETTLVTLNRKMKFPLWHLFNNILLFTLPASRARWCTSACTGSARCRFDIKVNRLTNLLLVDFVRCRLILIITVFGTVCFKFFSH